MTEDDRREQVATRRADRLGVGPRAIGIATIAAVATITVIAMVAPRALDAGRQRLGGQGDDVSTEVLRGLVDGYAHAIESNHHELALWYVHPRSPARPEIDRVVREQLGAYQEKARISRFEETQRRDGAVSAAVSQDVLRISGLKITRRARETRFLFRRYGDGWRIWTMEEQGAS